MLCSQQHQVFSKHRGAPGPPAAAAAAHCPAAHADAASTDMCHHTYRQREAETAPRTLWSTWPLSEEASHWPIAV